MRAQSGECVPCHSTETETDTKHAFILGDQRINIADAKCEKAEKTLNEAKLAETHLLNSAKVKPNGIVSTDLDGLCL